MNHAERLQSRPAKSSFTCVAHVYHPKVETNVAIQNIHYEGLASNMEFEDQTLLMESSRSQKWPEVTEVLFSKFGRGIVATRVFQKTEIVIDYHGQIFTKKSNDEVSAIESVKRNFVLK